MRYIMSRTAPNEVFVAVWGKSQYRDAKNRECSHRDYLRNNDISFEKVISVGDIHYDIQSGRMIIEPLPWETPENCTDQDKDKLNNYARQFFKDNNKEMGEEMRSDWNNYQIYMERQRQFLASQSR